MRGCGGNRTELGYNSNTCELMIGLQSEATRQRATVDIINKDFNFIFLVLMLNKG